MSMRVSTRRSILIETGEPSVLWPRMGGFMVYLTPRWQVAKRATLPDHGQRLQTGKGHLANSTQSRQIWRVIDKPYNRTIDTGEASYLSPLFTGGIAICSVW